MEVPDVSYAWSGDVAIAYQVVGEGPPDLVLLPFLANIYTLWHAPNFASMGRRLATGRRLTVVNPRGAGLSDRPRGVTIESRMDDLRAVMDELGVERAPVLGLAEAAASCAVFATASRPARRLGRTSGACRSSSTSPTSCRRSACPRSCSRKSGTAPTARRSPPRSPPRSTSSCPASAEPSAGEVLVSGTVKDLVAGSGMRLADRGGRELKGIPGEWRIYSVVDD